MTYLFLDWAFFVYYLVFLFLGTFLVFSGFYFLGGLDFFLLLEGRGVKVSESDYDLED